MTRFNKYNDKIGVLGLGYVGLPLSLLLGRNFKVIGYDSDLDKVKKIQLGKPPISEPQLDQLLLTQEIRKNVTFTGEKDFLRETQIKIITVGTPYNPEGGGIDYTQLGGALEALRGSLFPGNIVILKSTVPPGTTNNFVKTRLEEYGYKIPEEIGLAFSPERIIEGQAVKDFTALPKIIGASDQETMEIVEMVIGSLGGRLVKVSSIETAEMVKMVDNYSRYIFLALTNEIALISEKYCVDVLELLRSAKKDYPRNAGLLLPGPGVGGSCLNKDPFILKADLKKRGLDLRMIESAKEINKYMPKHIVELIERFSTGKRSVLLAGIAFKGDTDDTRYAPSLEIFDELKRKGFYVKATDPYVINQAFSISNDIYAASKSAEILVLLSDHSAYKNLDLNRIKENMAKDPIIFDSRGILDKTDAVNYGFEYHGLGRK